MGKCLMIGVSIGVLFGVVLTTVFGTARLDELIFQMVFGAIGGIGVGICYHLITREPPDEEESSYDYSPEPARNSPPAWIFPVVAFLAALVKGFMVASNM